MKKYFFGNGCIAIDFVRGVIGDLTYGDCSLIQSAVPLFTLCLRKVDGEEVFLSSTEAGTVAELEHSATYAAFARDVSVEVCVTPKEKGIEWGISVTNRTDLLLEWVDFPQLCLKPLKKNGGIGTILYPYNEGALVDEIQRRENSWFPSNHPSYPSRGSYSVFPNMICSQFMCYLFEGAGLYLGVHDPSRGVKHLDFMPHAGGVRLCQRLYCGTNAGEGYATDFPLYWQFFRGDWQDGADIYRSFFESNLPLGAKKISENPALPAWYIDSPLVVAYPVRGVHDMDEMNPNRLYPYENALPHLDEITEKTGSRILALLMHWEGTAPWAPPYVMPPYGSRESFDAFRDALHTRGHLLGVYCSGFGYTLQSNLIASYRQEPSEEEALAAMCTGYDGKVAISNICTAQRKGYDICPASVAGKQILAEAYAPLFESGVDYAQILDQNHGGGQYFCHSRVHGHPPVPGAWMTRSMQALLGEWNETAGKMLFGCESAAAEPFIGNLLFSDNRYELNYRIGRPVPLYAYLYHEYLRNFMGNQVCAPFDTSVDSLPMRLAYSFSIGDSMTLVMGQDGEFLSAWGQRDFSHLPDRERVLTLIRNLTTFYREEAGSFLYAGRMCHMPDYTCEECTFPLEDGAKIKLPAVFASAWEQDGERCMIFVNHTESEQICRWGEQCVSVAPMNAVMVRF